MSAPKALLALLTLAAFALRVGGIADLGELDYDEASSASLAALPPLTILDYVLTEWYEPHAPLFLWALHGWTSMVGAADPTVRLLSALFSTASVPLLGAGVSLAAGHRAGLLAALALTLAPIEVFYARYARMYAMASFSMALLVALIGRSLRPRAPSARLRAATGGAALFGLASHYYTGFGLLGAAPGMALTRLGPRFTVALLAIGGGLGLLWLSLAQGPRTSLVTAIGVPLGDPGLAAYRVVESLGVIAFPFGSPTWAAALLALAALMALVHWRRLPQPLALAALGGLLAPCLLVTAVAFLGRPFAPRYVIAAVPFAATLLGLTAARLPRPLLAGGLAVVVPLAVATLRPAYAYDCCDYRHAMGAMRAAARPDDAVVLHSWPQRVLYERYGADLPAALSPSSQAGGFNPDQALAAVERLSRQHPRLWLVESAPGYVDPGGILLGWLESRLYPVSQQRFHNALLRLYLTDGRAGSLESRPVEVELLGVRLQTVALEAWTLEAGQESRLRVEGLAQGGPARAKLSARLIGPDGANVWQQDRLLVRQGENVEVRFGLVAPGQAPPGRYGLELVVYEEGPLPNGASGILRTSDPVRVAELEVTARGASRR